MHLSSICRLFYYVYYFVAVKQIFFGGGGHFLFSNKAERGHQCFFVSITGGQRFCLG